MKIGRRTWQNMFRKEVDLIQLNSALIGMSRKKVYDTCHATQPFMKRAKGKKTLKKKKGRGETIGLFSGACVASA